MKTTIVTMLLMVTLSGCAHRTPVIAGQTIAPVQDAMTGDVDSKLANVTDDQKLPTPPEGYRFADAQKSSQDGGRYVDGRELPPIPEKAIKKAAIQKTHDEALDKINRDQAQAAQARDAAIAQLGPMVFRESTKLLRQKADRCMAGVDGKKRCTLWSSLPCFSPNPFGKCPPSECSIWETNDGTQCISDVRFAEGAEEIDRNRHEYESEAIERKYKSIERENEYAVAGVKREYENAIADLDREESSKESLRRYYESSMASALSAPVSSSSAAMAILNSDSGYKTPSPTIYLEPRPGTSITTFSGGAWTSRQGGTICTGGNGTATCY